jgi:hypothetical protein
LQSITCIGIATEHIAKNARGYITVFGLVRGLNTAGMTEGGLLYLIANGQLSNTPPAYPSNRLVLGICVRESVNNGKIFVRPTYIFRKFGEILTNNFTGFDDSGHMIMVNNARAWRDELGDAVSLRQQGTGLSTNVTESTADFSAASDLNDYLFKNLQLNHDRDQTSIISPHIHFFQTQNRIPNFLIEYRWQINGGVKVTPWTRVRCNVPAFTYTAGTIHQICDLASDITPPSGSIISDIVQFKIYRDNANASGLFSGVDTYTGAASVLSFDVHIQINSLGSHTEYVK